MMQKMSKRGLHGEVKQSPILLPTSSWQSEKQRLVGCAMSDLLPCIRYLGFGQIGQGEARVQPSNPFLKRAVLYRPLCAGCRDRGWLASRL